MAHRIPFNLPSVQGHEAEYVQQAIAGSEIAGGGPFTLSCETLLEQLLGVRRALLTTSCTHALELAALLLGIQPGDEVIIPSFAFVSTANAFALRGARPVFADIRPDTLNIDEASVAALVSGRTAAIVPIHYAGVGCEMDELTRIADAHGIPLVEDTAHGLFGAYRGRQLGTFGPLATLSFHQTKNFTSGEGGALLINDAAMVESAEIIREKGTNRSRFFRGQVDKYTWVSLGSSWVQSDLLAAYLLGQLEARDRIQQLRRNIWETYHSGLGSWAAHAGVRLPTVPEHCTQAYHMYYLLLPSLEARQAMIAYLDELGINSVFHYQPLHLSEMGVSFGGRAGQCPVTEDVSDRLLRLPFYTGMSTENTLQVIAAVTEFGL